jgi:carbonic anhydrase
VCTSCGRLQDNHSSGLTRRDLLRLASGAALSFGLLGRSQAAEVVSPPKPQNVVTPIEALERLMKGNERYVKGTMRPHDFLAERPLLAMGQNPFAAILGCADSRVAPEYAFDCSRGDLFVCRVAGNFADVNSVASLEYAVAVLGTPLILVLGHASCGAIKSAIEAVKDGTEFPGHIPSLIKALRPAVKAAQNQAGDLLDIAITQNVLLNVEKLRTAGPILSQAVGQGDLKVRGGVYSLKTGRVTLVV